jgi:hypothetical protein
VVIADIARETTQLDIQTALTAIQATLVTLSGKVDTLMSEDATVAAVVTAESADITALTSAVGSLQTLVTTLKSQTGLSPATFAALAAAQGQLDALSGTATADVAADQPPVPPVTGA